VKSCLIIGGTGTLGKELLPLILKRREEYGFSRIRVLSRKEHTQVEMARDYLKDPVDFILGDVRDRDRMMEASRDCSLVLHLAAFKSVDKAEYDPWECVLTNIIGTHNVIKAAQANGVSRCIYTSTDKAVAPLNVYGATKLTAEKVWIQGNVGSYETVFSAVRYGNVIGSQGSVIWQWRKGPPYYLTDPEMTRFFITPRKAALMVMDVYELMTGGEIFIPKMKATKMERLFQAAVGFDGQPTYTSRRPGEKVHECLVSADEACLVTDIGKYYVRWPSHSLFPITRCGKEAEIPSLGFTSLGAEPFTREELEQLCQT
jgi:UDP-N-acetylglucosamine 4,6-dehydratase